MRRSIAALGLTALIAVPFALAQDESRNTGRRSLFGGSSRREVPPAPAAGAAKSDPAVAKTSTAADADTPAKPRAVIDNQVFPASSTLPAPTPPDQIKPANVVLPTDAIEPWLLTKQNGPFMVMARTFRGPDAERYALMLAMELRRDHGLPAYILRTRDFPMRSNIRNVPPVADAHQDKAELTGPEKFRTYDEAAVLVGDEKTLAASEALLKRVKKIKPKCLEQIPSLLPWRTGLSTALRTTNPYVPTQNLFPGTSQADKLMAQMNSGPRSIFNCNGRYSLQVAEFGGRSTFNPSDKTIGSDFNDTKLKASPLATAADDAERVAEAIAKDPEIQRAGAMPFVFHDRTSSKVLVGSFNSPTDPNAAKLREILLNRATALADKKKANTWIAPAYALTDLEDPMNPIKSAR